MTLEVVVVGRTENFAGHAADGDDGKIALGRFDLDGLGAVEFIALFAQQMTHGGLAIEPDAVVGINDPERPLGLLRCRGEIDGVGTRVAQEDARDFEKAERLAGVPDLLDDGIHGGRGRREGDAQPWKWVWRRRCGTFVAAGWPGFSAVRPGSGTRSAGFADALETAAFVRARFTRLTRFTRFTRFAGGDRRGGRFLGP